MLKPKTAPSPTGQGDRRGQSIRWPARWS